MTLQVEILNDTAVVSINIEHLDANTISSFAKQLKSISTEHSNFILDLRLLQFIDSSGIGALLGAARRASKAGGSIKLVELSDSVKSIFELVNMDRLIDIFPTVDAAAASFSK